MEQLRHPNPKNKQSNYLLAKKELKGYFEQAKANSNDRFTIFLGLLISIREIKHFKDYQLTTHKKRLLSRYFNKLLYTLE